jgi:glycosyltransferase involved in cell wall biosynthesis
MHYSYESIGAVKPAQYVNSLINNLLLRYRFGSFSDVMRGYFQFAIVFFLHRAPYPGAKKQLLQAFAAHFSCISSFNNKSYARAQVGQFLEWDYEITRDNKIQTQKDCEFCPLVSIIVRTCQRAEVLREALISIRNQTYSNIEVIVVEDGEASAEKMIVEEFSDLNIRYYSTGKKAGRSEAGNLALSKAAGEYINFLDDDDIFFADHVETLVQALAQNRKYLAAYAFGFETPVVVESTSPYKYHIKAYNKRYTTAFDEVELCYHNFIPIQCIMFSRRLYEEFGGFDSSLDYLEDWDLWVRYAQRTKYICVEKTTSLYRVPFEQKIQKERQHQLDEALKTVRKKHESYEIPVSAARLAVYGKKRIWEK